MYLGIYKRGVSMMEVLTAVIIISILSSVSYVAWRQYIRNAITTEAKVNLSMIFAAQSQYKATCETYYPDLEVIGALPKGKLYYNMGGKFDSNTDWGKCLTNKPSNCNGCKTHFDEFCCDQVLFENTSEGCPCYIREDYEVSKTNLNGSNHVTSKNYCGTLNKGILKNRFCVIAATAINRSANEDEWDVWVGNHLNVIKQVASP